MSVTEGFLKAWGMILVSEIGDKTFFIAAILSMKNSRCTVFAGAMAALTLMTIISAILGWATPNLISKKFTNWASVLLFFVFGVRSLYDAYYCTNDSEWEEVEKEMSEMKESDSHGGRLNQFFRRWMHQVFAQAFILTFLAEWGDRSQIATIGLAAATDVPGVTLGGILGHAICTGTAVLGGRHMSSFISERMVGLCGGTLFLAFAAHAAWSALTEMS